jgi:uncharacterized membrane protein
MNKINSTRIKSIDVLRGLIMIIMALDHTRDYFNADAFLFDPLNLDKTNVLLFFTRWITHFCAPIFILLAGTSAFISGQKKTKKELSSFLVKRGLWLVFLELTVVNFAWFFNIHFSFILLAVIWALGICMIFLAGIIFLPGKVILWLGIILVAGHNLLDNIHFPGNNFMAYLWSFLHEQNGYRIANHGVLFAYPILPWIGVMALGYCLGELFSSSYDPIKRRKLLLTIGSSALVLFVILRGINVYGNLKPWKEQSSAVFSFLSFLDITKYPPSLDYILLTDGTALVFLSLIETISNRFTRFVSVYGRVPMFYYLLHIYLIHLIALMAAVLTGFEWTQMTSFNTWVTYSGQLKGYGFSLGVVYLVWISVVILLYPLCKWYDRYKSSHREKWWLSYL